MSQQAVFEPLELKEVLTELLINPGLEPIVKNPKKAETIGGSPVTHGGGERAFAVIIWPKMFHNPDIRLTKKKWPPEINDQKWEQTYFACKKGPAERKMDETGWTECWSFWSNSHHRT